MIYKIYDPQFWSLNYTNDNSRYKLHQNYRSKNYDLRIPSHEISKTSYIRYDMKSTKMIVWSRWDHSPSIFEEIDSEEWDAMKSLAKVVEILEEFSMISTRISTNLSDRLGFDSWPYPKSFMSLMWMKDYIYMVINNGKVP